MFMVNWLCRALIYKFCNKYFHKKVNSLTSRRQSFNCHLHTLTHTHTHTLQGFVHVIFRAWLNTILPNSPRKKERKKSQFTLPQNLENPPSPDIQSVCTTVARALQPYRACSKRCHCFSYSLAWQQTGIWGHHPPNSGYYNQHHCELGFKQNYNSWIWYSESCDLFSKDKEKMMAIDSLTSQYSKK